MSLDSDCKLFVRDFRQFKLLLVITRALTKSVVVIAVRSVDASVSESEDQLPDPSAEMDSKQETTEENRSLNR